MQQNDHGVIREQIHYSQEEGLEPVSLEVLVRGQGPLIVLIA